MEYHLEVKNNSGDPQSSRTSKKVIAPRASQSLKLGDRFKLERPSLSYADFHHEITEDTGHVSLKSSGYHPKQQIGKRAVEDDELIRYMSNLPSYLERREKIQDAPFSVGVLDWGRLEKWKDSNKKIPHRSSGYSPSSSTASSYFSTDLSSSKSSQGHSCSPTRQSMHRPTLQSHLKASPQGGHLESVKSSPTNGRKFQDLKASDSGISHGQKKFLKKDLCNGQSEAKQKESVKKDFDPEILVKMKFSSYLDNCEGASHPNGNSKTGDGEFPEKVKKVETSNSDILNRDFPDSNTKVVLLLPKDSLQKRNGVSQSRLNDSMTVMGHRSAEASQGIAYPQDVHYVDLRSDVPRSYPLPYHDDKHRQMRHRSVNAPSTDKSPDASEILQYSAKMHLSPCRGREEEKPAILPSCSTGINPPHRSNMTTSKMEVVKARTCSPTRRFSFSVGILSRNSNSKKDSDASQPSSTCVTNNSGANGEAASACLDDSKSDKLGATTRARSSPLRRLLYPLLKSRESNSRHSRSVEASRKLSASRDEEVCRSSNREADSVTVHSAKVKLDSTSCKSSSRDVSYQNGMHRSGNVQSLLKVTIKNGLPLFTFATDNNRDILAATLKKLSTLGKNENSYLCTFFSVREIKKKSWINQGEKGKPHDYIPNVVGRMEVSEFSQSTGDHPVDHYTVKECVLFAVDLRQAEKHKNQLQPSDELAAIVVKIPKQISGNLNQDELRSPIDHSTTVILPSASHTLPSKGEPSSLVERWRSGGVCDCGGWDLGCKLRVLNDHKQLDNRSSLSKTCSTERFQLFNQGGVQENLSIFSLTRFKDGVFSVEFDSSISLLQAFSICIAAVDSRQPSLLPELSTSVEGRSSEDKLFVNTDEIKAAKEIQAEVPARYVSYPPHSPAGRV